MNTSGRTHGHTETPEAACLRDTERAGGHAATPLSDTTARAFYSEIPASSSSRPGYCAEGYSSSRPSALFAITLPWPRAELSPNFRTRRTNWVARLKKEYREAVAQAAWDAGVQPGRSLRLDQLIYHPPVKRKRDDDNMEARFKAGRDGLAQAMGVDDSEFNDAAKDFGEPVKGGAVIAVLTEIPD